MGLMKVNYRLITGYANILKYTYHCEYTLREHKIFFSNLENINDADLYG